ncbi:FCD domain-containing protein [Aestuariivirga sp.]|uniref:FCD domain-containing protein n=1 Tax=Aestuariivirga sp. TaxID=2650926 RepID=UPI003BAADC64
MPKGTRKARDPAQPEITQRDQSGPGSAKPPKASDRVASAISAAIDAGSLAPGERLPPERELMGQYGVGRSAVREAIAALATRGVLKVRPGCRPVIQGRGYETALATFGNLVSHMVEDASGIENLFGMRVFVEAALVRHAAQHATPRDIQDLREALEQNRAAMGDPEAFYRTDVAFHRVLYMIAGNPILPVIHKLYVDWLYAHWIRMPRSPDINRMNHSAHAAILDAIVDRDPDSAENLLRSHLATAWQFVRSTFESSN